MRMAKTLLLLLLYILLLSLDLKYPALFIHFDNRVFSLHKIDSLWVWQMQSKIFYSQEN